MKKRKTRATRSRSDSNTRHQQVCGDWNIHFKPNWDVFLTLINMKLSKSTQNSSETDKLRLFCGFAETYVAATLRRSGSLCDPPLFRHHVGLNISHEINYTSLCFRLQKPIFPPTAAHPASQLLIVVHLRPQHREERRRSLNTDDQTKIQSTGWLVGFLFWSESQLLKDCFSNKRTIIQ